MMLPLLSLPARGAGVSRQGSSYLLALALVLVVVAALAAETSGAAAPRMYRSASRINRRGFKSSLLSTARGFGKRGDAAMEAVEARAAEAPEAAAGLAGLAGQRHPAAQSERRYDLPVRLLVEEAMESPRLLFTLVNLLDQNNDGVISSSELVRPRDVAGDVSG